MTAFDELYTGEYARLVGELTALTGDRASAEDCVQEAFARAYGGWSRVGGLDQPAAWVRRVAMNLAVSRWRRLRHLVTAPGGATSSSPDEGIDLRAELDRLPLAQRRVLVLHHVAGLSVAEIAAELGVPEGTVKARLSRSRARLRDRLSVEEGS